MYLAMNLHISHTTSMYAAKSFYRIHLSITPRFSNPLWICNEMVAHLELSLFLSNPGRRLHPRFYRDPLSVASHPRE